MKSRSLLVQVLAVNLLLVAGSVLVVTVAVDAHLGTLSPDRGAFVLALAIVATLLGNWLLLRRRFEPLDQLISSMEEIDLAAPRQQLPPRPRLDSAEARRLEAAFRRMIGRLEAERREAGRAAIRAQERERRRIAQDLHDEVNQALTAVSLRLQASIEQAPADLRSELTETKRLSTQAMEELLEIARHLRPAVLDDHGLTAALHSQVRDFADRTGIHATFTAGNGPAHLTADQQLVIYRVTQESLSNVAQHAGAANVEVTLETGGPAGGPTVLTIRDDGRGFDVPRAGGLGLKGMRERALLIGAELRIRSRAGAGTEVELTIG